MPKKTPPKPPVKLCLCGALLDDTGRCPRQEREICKIFQSGTLTNYVNALAK